MQPITVRARVRLDAKVFRQFALFDTLILHKRWRAPALFSGILLLFGGVCFTIWKSDDARLIGSVLWIIGFGLPLVYFLSYLFSIQSNIQKQKLPRMVYELELSNASDGIHVHSLTNTQENQTLEWSRMFGAYRSKECIYLYAIPSRAFLLPNGCASVSDDELWLILTERMPKGRCVTRIASKQSDNQ